MPRAVPTLGELLTREGHGAQRWRVSYRRRLKTLRDKFCGGKKLRIVSREVARRDGEGTTTPEGMSYPWCTCCSLSRPLFRAQFLKLSPQAQRVLYLSVELRAWVSACPREWMQELFSKGGIPGRQMAARGLGHSSICL